MHGPGQEKAELLIVGASARAAAQSAIAAGFQVTAIDLFGDADLRSLCEVRVAQSWPADVPELAAELSPRLWMYTGALENHPDIIATLSERHHLLGCSGSSLAAVRDPIALYEAATREGILMPETRRASPGACGELIAGPENWLRKPVRSAGGSGICRWPHGEAESCAAREEGSVFQREIVGTSFGAVFLFQQSGYELWGVTQQLVGLPELGAAEFQYCGSLGPVELAAEIYDQVRGIGDFLAQRYSFRGLIGVDFIVSDGRVWLLEVNPRYTASAEVLERASGISAVAQHAAVCEDAPSRISPVLGEACYAKGILFADQRVEISSHLSEHLLVLAKRDRTLADIPTPGTAIDPGQPILTFFVECDEIDGSIELLRQRAAELRALVNDGGEAFR